MHKWASFAPKRGVWPGLGQSDGSCFTNRCPALPPLCTQAKAAEKPHCPALPAVDKVGVAAPMLMVGVAAPRGTDAGDAASAAGPQAGHVKHKHTSGSVRDEAQAVRETRNSIGSIAEVGQGPRCHSEPPSPAGQREFVGKAQRGELE
jgi:hypothetical protein